MIASANRDRLDTLPPSRSGGPATRFVDRQFFRIAALPAAITVAAVSVIPILAGIALSLTGYSDARPLLTFAGFRNFYLAFTDPLIGPVVRNTVAFAAGTLFFNTILGLCLAVLLNRRFRGVTIFRVLYLVPLMVAPIAYITGWKALLTPSAGWVNYFLQLAHLPQPNWLASPSLAIVSTIIVQCWTGIPGMSVLLLAALLGVSPDSQEQAAIDGAHSWQIFRYVTFPSIRPVMAFAMLFQTVALFQQFGLFQILTGGGPGMSTDVLNFYVYQNTFTYGNYSYGSTLAVILMAMMAIPLVIFFRLARSSS